MLKWLNAFAFCLWEHENKSWIRGPVKLSSSVLSFCIYTYISVRGSKIYPKAVRVSKLQRRDHPFDLHRFIFHPSLKGHNSSCIPSPVASGKHGWPELGDSFSFPRLPTWGQPVFEAKQKVLLHVFRWHPQFRLPSHLFLMYHLFSLFMRLNLGTSGSGRWLLQKRSYHWNHHLSKTRSQNLSF